MIGGDRIARAERGAPSFQLSFVTTHLHVNPFNLVKADVVAAPVVELGGARRRVIGHRRGVLERTAAF